MGSRVHELPALRALPVTVALALALASLSPAFAGAPAAVRTGDGLAACVLSSSVLLCTNRRLQARRPAVAFVLHPRRGTSVIDRKLAWSHATSTMRPGRTRRIGSFTCSVSGRGLLCRNGNGDAIAASGARISSFVAPATYP